MQLIFIQIGAPSQHPAAAENNDSYTYSDSIATWIVFSPRPNDELEAARVTLEITIEIPKFLLHASALSETLLKVCF